MSDNGIPSDILNIGRAVQTELQRVIYGQPTAIQSLLVAVTAGGHVLLEGVPGVAKTLLARSLAAALRCGFSRIQFTPDLMPADITGVSVFESATREFSFRPGPLFSDVVLADEINRAPAKTQAALLEAMQEYQVSVDGQSRALSRCFTVVATQNPIEYEGTYPLPEAQLDRFLMKVIVDYPGEEEERAMLRAMHSSERPGVPGPCDHPAGGRPRGNPQAPRRDPRDPSRRFRARLHAPADSPVARFSEPDPRREPARGDHAAPGGQGAFLAARQRLRHAG